MNWIWQGCAVALAAFAALRVLDRSRAQARYALAGLALVAVLALPVLSWQPSGVPVVGSGGLTDGSTGIAVSIPTAWWTSATIVFSLCGLWCAVQVLRAAAMMAGIHRARRTSLPVPAAVQARLPCWTAVRDRGRSTRLVLSASVPSAAVLGCGSPIIALAPALLQHLSDDELDRVVLHEWAHVQRRDDLLNVIHIAVRAVAGWHPAVMALERQLRIEREAACDEMAVAVTGSPKHYASCLTTIAALGAGRQPASALGAFSSPALTQRVVRILSYGTLASAKWSGRTAGAAVVLLVVFSVSIAGVQLIAKAGSDAGASQTATPAATDRRDESPGAIVTTTTTLVRANRRPTPAAPDTGQAIAPAMPAASRTDGQAVVPDVPLSSTTSQTIVALATVDMRPPPAIAGLATAPPRPPADTPWGAAADAGLAIGRGSQKAGTATAGFFSRVGKGIARSFSN